MRSAYASLFRALRCRLFDLDAFGNEHGIERVSELAIAVTDREAERSGALTKFSRRSAWPAGLPNTAFGISSDTEDADTAYLALEDEENVDATETHQIDVKKVASQRKQESAPGQSALRMGAGASRWRRGSCGSSRPRRVPPASQLAVDPRVSPCVVVVGRKHDQLHEIFADRRPSWCLGAPPPAGGQALVPAQYRTRDDEAVCA
jgi:hypothetical protein